MTTVTSIRNTLPPSSAGMGSIFIIARFIAMNAEKYSMLYTASAVLSA